MKLEYQLQNTYLHYTTDLNHKIEQWLSSAYTNDTFETHRDYCFYIYETILDILGRKSYFIKDKSAFKNDIILFLYNDFYD